MAAEIVLEGGEGEGSGQVLRTALALSLVTGRPFEILRLRPGGKEPGLQAPHLAAIEAVRTLTSAVVDGAVVGSQRVTFAPTEKPIPGTFELDAGGGSAALLLQMLAAPLALAGGVFRVRVKGGTHVADAPSFHDLALAFGPLLELQNFPVALKLGIAGFQPEGGGRIDAVIRPAGTARSLDLRRRGTLGDVKLIPMAAGVEADVPVRMAAAAERVLRSLGIAAQAASQPLPAGPSHGAALALSASYEKVTVTFGALSEQGKTAEAVGREVAQAFSEHHASGMAVSAHLADPLLVPLALASAGLLRGSTPIHRFTCSSVSPHLLATAQVVRRFLPVEVAIFGREGEPGDVRVAPSGIGEVLNLRGGVTE